MKSFRSAPEKAWQVSVLNEKKQIPHFIAKTNAESHFGMTASFIRMNRRNRKTLS